MRKLLMLALLVAVLLPAGSTLAASPPSAPLPETPQSTDGTVVPVDPPPFIVIDGILWKFKGPIDGHAGWLRMKVISSTNADLVSKKVKVKIPPQILFTVAAGADKLHVMHVRVWVPRNAHGLVASAIELG
jgi:hypothetical protein